MSKCFNDEPLIILDTTLIEIYNKYFIEMSKEQTDEK